MINQVGFVHRTIGRYFAAVVLLTATSGWAQITPLQTTCVNESNGQTNVCTANDLTFVQLGLGVQSDGCVNPSDRVSIFMRGALQNSTAQARYDVGIWFPRDDGGTIDPEGDGAASGLCNLVGLMNPEPAPPTDACVYDVPAGSGALDLLGGSGPWVNTDGTGNYDSCGDIYANASSTVCDGDGDGNWDDSIIYVSSDITVDCNDADLGGLSDGFVSMPICLTWGNQANQVDNDGNNLCDSLSELQPGTKSKCRCEQYQTTDIPAPDLGLTCSLPAGVTTVQPGGSIQVTITYTNSCTCTPDALTPERFQCCTASYLQFPIDYNEIYGSVSSIDAGSGSAADVGGYITWTPGTDEIIAGSETDTLTFVYTANATGDGDVTAINVATNWSNLADFSSAVNQAALTSQCQFFINSTWATISGVKADVRRGRTVVSWETSAEVGTVGYDVFRSDAASEQWTRVNKRLLPAVSDGPGGRYELVDEDGPTKGIVEYVIREVDAWGGHRESSPAKVTLRDGSGPAPPDVFVAEKRGPSRRIIEARDRSSGRPGVARQIRAGVKKKPNAPTIVKIGVGETGLYRVSAAVIAAAFDEPESKIEAAIKKQGLTVSTGGQSVAWRAENGAHSVIFFGEAPDNLYDAERIYVVTGGRGLAMEEPTGAALQPAGEIGSFHERVVREEDLLLRPFNVAGTDEDYWFWSVILASDPVYGEDTLEFNLDGVANVGSSARLGVDFVAFGPDARLGSAVLVNGHFVGDLEGPGISSGRASFEFDQAFLLSGTNSVTFVGEQSGFFVDRLDIAYERLLQTSTDEITVRTADQDTISIEGFTTSAVEVYDISNALRPVLLPSSVTPASDARSFVASFAPTTDEGRYLATSSIAVRSPANVIGRSPANLSDLRRGADYVIVTTGDLVGTAERLAAHRQESGLETMVVDVQDIFDEFSFGSRDPAAIQAFLVHAVSHWATPPRYVLLAGRGHYDYKDYMGFGGNLLPPLLAATERGLVPSDNRIADLNGDGAPDLAIGRLPVLTPEELAAVIDKIIEYESVENGPWARRVVLAADNPDSAGDFVASSDVMALALPDDRSAEKAYLYQPYSAEQVHDLMVAALGDGVGLLTWTGHAGLDSLAHERVLQISDLEDLQATKHAPVFLGLTCLMNQFAFPYFAALGEELVLEPDGGAIAVWAATGFSDNGQAERLGKSFMAALNSNQELFLGDIIGEAIENYLAPGADPQMVDVYVLFGDPALILK